LIKGKTASLASFSTKLEKHKSKDGYKLPIKTTKVKGLKKMKTNRDGAARKGVANAANKHDK